MSKDLTTKPVTIKMLDYFQGDEGKWIDATIAGFEKKHPNVTIKRTVQDWGQVMNTLNLRLADANGPDIATVNNGWQSMGTLAQGGRIMNLDAYSNLYGWKKEIPNTMLRQLEFTPDGKEMGTGSLYATPTARSSLIGLYYNKSILDKAGIAVPKTLDDFEKALATAEVRRPGPDRVRLRPEGLGDRPPLQRAGPVRQRQEHRRLRLLGRQRQDGRHRDHPGGDHHQEVGRLRLLHAELPGPPVRGCTGPVHARQGRVPLRVHRCAPLHRRADRQNYGYIQLPQANSSKVVGTGSPSGNLSISTKSKNPDVAAAFLDYLTNKQTAQLAVDRGYLPPAPQRTEDSVGQP